MQHMRAQFHHSATYFAISIAPLPYCLLTCHAMQCYAMPAYATAVMRLFKGTEIEALIGHIVNIV